MNLQRMKTSYESRLGAALGTLSRFRTICQHEVNRSQFCEQFVNNTSRDQRTVMRFASGSSLRRVST